MIIQVLLVLGVLILLAVFVRGSHGVRIQASKRIAFVLFMLVNVYAVLRPGDVSRVAHAVGVGRGTDLVLYLTVVALVFIAINFYLRSKEAEDRITDLARAVAVRDAEFVNTERGLLTGTALAREVAEPPVR